MPGRSAWQAWLLGLALALSACGGGGGGDEPPAPPEITGNFFPLAEGDRWYYDWNGVAEATARVTGRRSVQGEEGWVVQTAEPGGNDGESVYLVSAGRVRQVPVYLPDAVAMAVGPVDVMRLPLHQGDRFVQIDKTVDLGMDLDGDGRHDVVSVHSAVEVIAVEPVDTLSGQVDGALHQRTTMTLTPQAAAGGTTQVVVVTIDDWYGPDLGPVRSETSTQLNGQTVESTRYRLSAYRVGGRHSEAVAPLVTTTEPAAGAVHTAVASVAATFSEVMDSASAGQAFTLRDGQGQTVAGTVRVDGAVLRFQPAQALPSGVYSAHLAASAEDRAGNALGSERAWAFEVDSTAPGLVGSTPADGSTDASRDAAIVLRFSEVLDPNSVNSNTVIFSGGAAQLEVDGNTVTLTPSTTLQRLTDYTVQTTPGLRDRVGNALVNGGVVQFRTDAGRFAAPVALPAAANAGVALHVPSPMAIGDVNSDGRADVLAAGYDAGIFPGTYHLLVWHQQPDGSRGPAETLALAAAGPAGGCWVTSIEVGDLDSDGRNDVALAQRDCGITVLRQDTNGHLVPGPVLTGAASDKLRLVDMDRDGRLDVVSVGTGSTAAQVWRQTAGGAFVLVATPAVPAAFEVDLATGDLNGDGRPDIVVAGVSAPGASVGVLLQQPDGGFAVPLYLAPDGRGVAVADVDGDGRDDLVVTLTSNAPAYAAVYHQRSDGTLADPVLLPSHDLPLQVVASDVNGDGRRDVVVAHAGWRSVGVYLQQASGGLAAEARYTADTGSQNPRSLAVGDVNGDGRPDIVVEGQVLLQRAVGVQSQSVPPWSGAWPSAWQALRRQAAR